MSFLVFSGSPARSASGPGTQWAPRVGPFGPLGPLRGPKGPLGLGGYSEAISNGWPLRMEGNFDWNAISNGRSFGYMGLLPNSAPARLNQPFRFKNIPSKSAVFTPMLSRPAEAPTKTGAEIHPKPSSIHVEIASLAFKIDLDDISVHVSQCFKQTSPHSRQMPLGPIMDPCPPPVLGRTWPDPENEPFEAKCIQNGQFCFCFTP